MIGLKHVSALGLKFVMTTVLLWLVMFFFRIPFATILWMSVILTVVSYVVGDLAILPIGGNFVASLADFGLTCVGVWLMGQFVFDKQQSLLVAAFSAAVLMFFGEWFFHAYLKNSMLKREKVEM
jgi:hypothetical protein